MFNLDFTVALDELGPDAAFRVANEARPPGNYLFNTLLPEMLKYTYNVESGSMIVRATMAGLVGMDSPYPPGGHVETSKFLEESAKIANEVGLPEKLLRELQQMLMQLRISNQPTVQTVQQEALNFLSKVIVQAHLDTMEWLRGQALVAGKIDWTFGQIKLLVDYGIPSDHFLATRTAGSNEAYGGSSSKFWDDVKSARRKLRNNMRAAIAHPDTIDEILYNSANDLQVLSQDNSTFRVRRYREIQGNTVPTSDVRETIELVAYDLEADVIDPNDPSKVKQVPFMPRGKILFVASNSRSSYRVGEGSTDDPQNDMALGYTHLAPTVEGGGRPGRWAELYTPEREPWSLHGRGVTNGLPVIENPDKIVVATTESVDGTWTI